MAVLSIILLITNDPLSRKQTDVNQNKTWMLYIVYSGDFLATIPSIYLLKFYNLLRLIRIQFCVKTMAKGEVEGISNRGEWGNEMQS